jgi:hypothetical protein
MSGKGSEEVDVFVEGDHETKMAFDDGGFPIYIKVAWVALFAGYAIYMYVYGLPDFIKWGMP